MGTAISAIDRYEDLGAPDTALDGIVYVGTWASRPAASAFPVGSMITITDVGFAGYAQFFTDGTYWRPINGVLGLARSAAPSTTLTGSTSETVLDQFRLPAGILNSLGSLRVTSRWGYTTSANNKTLTVRLGGTGTNGTTTQATIRAAFTATQLQVLIQNTAVAAQLFDRSNVSGGTYDAASGAFATGAVDTSVDQTVYLNGTLQNGADSLTLQSWFAEILA